MRPRHVITVALALAVLPAASPADAACRLFEDERGTGGGVASSDRYDIVYGDLTIGRSEVVFTLGVADFDDAPLLTTAFDEEWQLGANGSGTRYEFSMRESLSGQRVSTARVGDAAVRHTFAVNGDTLVWRVKRKDAPALNRAKLFWTAGSARTRIFGSTADDAQDNHRRCR